MNLEQRERLPYRGKDLRDYSSGDELRYNILRFRREHPNYTWENLRPRSLNAIRESNPYLFVLYPLLHVPVAMAFAGEGMAGLAVNIMNASWDPETGEFKPDEYEKARGIITNQHEELGGFQDISHARGIWDLGQETSNRFGIQIQLTQELRDVAFRFNERMNRGLNQPRTGPLYGAIMEASGKKEDMDKGNDGWMAIEFGDIEVGGKKLGLSTKYSEDNLLADKEHGDVMCDIAVDLARLDDRFALSADEVYKTLVTCHEDRGKFWYELDEVIDQQLPDIWKT